jgi:hypothetical protein
MEVDQLLYNCLPAYQVRWSNFHTHLHAYRVSWPTILCLFTGVPGTLTNNFIFICRCTRYVDQQLHTCLRAYQVRWSNFHTHLHVYRVSWPTILCLFTGVPGTLTNNFIFICRCTRYVDQQFYVYLPAYQVRWPTILCLFAGVPGTLTNNFIFICRRTRYVDQQFYFYLPAYQVRWPTILFLFAGVPGTLTNNFIFIYRRTQYVDQHFKIYLTTAEES